MTTQDMSVSVQPRNSGYKKLGTGDRVGIVPESISYDAELVEKGCLEASWKMYMNPGFDHKDLEHYTPVVIDYKGEPVWSGRIIEAPTEYGESGIITVKAQGWPQHLKDDCMNKLFVSSELTQWNDISTFPLQDMTLWPPFGGTVSSDGGALMFQVPNATVVPANARLGAQFDCGPNNLATTLVIDWAAFGNDASAGLYWGTSADGIVSASSGLISTLGASPSGLQTITLTTPARYVRLFYYRGSGATYSSNLNVRINAAIVSTSASYISSNASALKASTIIKEALSELCPFISSDQSQVTDTSFNIPNFPGQIGNKYPHEYIDLANAYHGYEMLLTPDPVPLPIFRAIPTAPKFVVGVQDDYSFTNPSQSDGRNVYSRVIAEYADANGVDSSASTSNPTVLGTPYLSESQLSNPSFDTNTTGWTAYGNAGSSIARNTGTFDTTPAGLSVITGTAGNDTSGVYTTSFATPLKIGKRYRIEVRVYPLTTVTVGKPIDLYVYGASGTIAYSKRTTSGASSTWMTISLDFTAEIEDPRVDIIFYSTALVSTPCMVVDTFQIYEFDNNLVSKRGFVRTAIKKIDGASTAAAALAIAQIKLDNSQYPPLRGTLVVKGRIRLVGGGSIHVSKLVRFIGEAVVIENMKDPVSGAQGRQGIIGKVSYEHDTQSATLEIDTPQDFIDVLISRMALLTS